MPMRVTHSYRYDFFIENMNRSLSDWMNLNEQAASQKKINRPSDDPVGMARILKHRDTLSALDRYRKNVDTAKGWLGLADESLMQANTIVNRLKEIAEQASTGTMSADNREQVSYEARQLFNQLISIANTKFENKHIFAGHKVDETPFEESLWMSTNDDNIQNFSIRGSTPRTIVARFLDSGDVDTDTLDYEYSTDGGATFTQATLAAGTNTLDLGSVQVSLEDGATVSAYDPSVGGSANNGTWMWVRPSAEYHGDDLDGLSVDSLTGSTLDLDAQGEFSGNVTVRIDDATDLASDVEYSYSLDGGMSWVTGNEKNADGTLSNASLVIPGGYLVLGSNGGSTLSAGNQFVVRPRTAAINLEISPNNFVQINNVGKDIFGGVYEDPSASNASPVFGGDARNLLEAAGELVGYLETNNQAGVQESLENLRVSSNHILNMAARIGARENRLNVSDSMLETLEYNEQERLSHTEDADLTEVMTQLASRQIAYQTVLKSSTTIMRMMLSNFM